MRLSDFDYKLPPELISQTPIEPRDHSRLLVLDKKSGKIKHKHFYDLVDFLKEGDVLVLNNSKVIKARLFGRKRLTNGKVEILLHRETNDGEWEVIGKNLKAGLEIIFENSHLTAIVERRKDDAFILNFNMSGDSFFKEIDRIGVVPLPPYIKRSEQKRSDESNYQTVFAKERGSVAAPTAGLHLTDDLILKLKNNGVIVCEVTLHVGLGTFSPVTNEDIVKHKMHSEYYSATKENIEKITKAKKEDRRVIAVGTTSARVLETVFSQYRHPDGAIATEGSHNHEILHSAQNDIGGWTNIFIYPGYKFKCVDGLITNFHLPKTTLLMLVSAFAGKDNILKAYQEATKEKYRFYSYGDAMLIV